MVSMYICSSALSLSLSLIPLSPLCHGRRLCGDYVCGGRRRGEVRGIRRGSDGWGGVWSGVGVGKTRKF